ncbi:hypothetical protein TNIN_384741 [Trichonephila inaurata madagascariensis]|uniref:Uncharacterized protein n=1 Tax=Trichonephila inaurata madagascariensis TaxID=2747483 RepID=A0A8X6YIU2_9ARAC|nr:hypothetical protein TNIN_384741 [Trichonephila inaurata madagascariensis]
METLLGVELILIMGTEKILLMRQVVTFFLISSEQSSASLDQMRKIRVGAGRNIPWHQFERKKRSTPEKHVCLFKVEQQESRCGCNNFIGYL